MKRNPRGPLFFQPNRRPAVLAGSIAVLLAWGLSSSSLKADSIVVGAGPNGAPQVTLLDSTELTVQQSYNAFSSTGGVTVAAGDGFIVLGEGSSGGEVDVYDAATFTLVQTLHPFGFNLTSGVTVAVGDGKLVVGNGAGGGSQVSVFSDSTFMMQNSFTAFAPTFTGGVNVALGGGRLVVGEASGGSQIKLYNDSTLSPQDAFTAFGSTFTGGVTVAVGDGILVAGQGAGGTAQVNVFDPATHALQVSFNPFASGFTGAANVAVGNGQIVAGAGPGGSPTLAVYDASTFALKNISNALDPSFTGGVTVAVVPASLTWTGAGSGDWNTDGNWSSAGVPNSADAIAVFDASSRTGVSLSANTEVNNLTFTANAAANPYTITVNPGVALTISGTGIANNSGVAQTLVTAADGSGNAGTIMFTHTATAGTAAIVNHGGAAAMNSAGATIFSDSSSAGQATITNQAGSNTLGGSTVFDGGSAGTATITNQGGDGPSRFGGSTIFNGGRAGNATITANGATDGSASSGGQIIFNSGVAEEAILTANGGTVDSAPGGVITFNGGGAGIATISIKGGQTANAKGGAIFFKGDSDGGAAAVTVAAGGIFDISGLTGGGPAGSGMSIGSIQGAGNFFLGGNRLTVGNGDGQDYTVSGVIADGGQAGGSGGSLFVSGSSSLTLTGQNTYTGRTGITNGGTLNANAPGALPSPVADGGQGSARTDLYIDHVGSGYSTLNLGASQAVASLVSASTSTINLNGHVLTVGNNGSARTIFAGSISDGTGSAGLGGFTVDGTATQVLSGFNRYTGATVVNGASTLVIGDGMTGNLVATSGVTVAGGAALAINLGDGDFFRPDVTLNGGSVDAANLNAIQSGTNTLSGVISGTGILSQSGSGTTVLTGVNTYSNATFVNAGVLRIGSPTTAGSIANTSIVVLADKATLTLVNIAGGIFDRDVDNFSGGTSTVHIFSANSITLGRGVPNQMVTGVIENSSGTVGLTKDGPGIAIIISSETYTGPTQINGGILEVDGGLGHTLVTVGSGGALRGNGTIFGSVVVQTGGALQPTGSTTDIVGNLTLNSGANMNVRLDGGTFGSGTGTADEELLGGNLILGGNLNLTPLKSFAVGTYPLFGLDGTVTGHFSNITGLPGYTTTITTAPVAGGTEVNLVVSRAGALPTLAWDGVMHSDMPGGSGTFTKTAQNWTASLGGTDSIWQGGTAVFANTPGTVTLGDVLSAQGLTFAASGYVIAPSSPTVGSIALTGKAPLIDVVDAASTATINAPVISSTGLIANGTGTLILASSANSIAGNVSVNTGKLQLGTAAAASSFGGGAAGMPVVLNDGGTLAIVNLLNNELVKGVTAGLGQSGTVNFASPNDITLSGALTDNAPGQLALTINGSGTAILTNANNTFTGATTIARGTLQIGTATDAGSLGAASPVIFTGRSTLLVTNVGSGVFANSITNASAGPANVVVSAVGLDVTLTGSLVDSSGGALTLTKNGTGTATLTGRSSYFGTTGVNAGKLQIGDGFTSGTAIANSSVQVNGTAILALNLAGASTFANDVLLRDATASLTAIQQETTTLTGTISGNGVLNQRGTGTTVLARDETYIGATTVGAGILQIGNGLHGNLTGSTSVTVVAVGTLATDLGDQATFSQDVALSGTGTALVARQPGYNLLTGLISGAGAFVQNGLGETELTQAETYSGGTTVNAGILFVDTGLAEKTVVNVNGGTLLMDGTLPAFNTVKVGTAGTLGGKGTMHGSVFLTGNGIIALSHGIIDGPLTVTGGQWSGRGEVTGKVTAGGSAASVFTIGPRSGLLASGSSSFISQTTLLADGGVSVTRGQLAGTGSLNADLTYTSAADSTFAGQIIGGSVTMKKAGATLTLTGASIYRGGTTVSAGTLQVGDGQTAGPSSETGYPLGVGPVTVSGKGTLVADLIDQSVFPSPVNLSTAGATLKAIQGGTTIFSGAISGLGGFTQAGLGTSVLPSHGGNSYSGATNVFSGTLQVDSALLTSTVHVGTAGTLTGSGANLSNVTLTGNGVIDFTRASSMILGNLQVTGGHWNGVGSVLGAVTSSSGNFTLDGNLTTSHGLTVTGGTLSGTGTLNGDLTYRSGSASTFAGVIAGASQVEMERAGASLTLSGSNTYAGPTIVSAGTLNVTGSLGMTQVTVAAGGILAGTGTINGSEFVAAGGTFAPGNMDVPGNFTVGNLQIVAGSIIKYVLGGAGATAVGNSDLTIVNGTATFAGTLNVSAGFGFGAGTYDLLDATGQITLGTVPIGTVPLGFTKANFTVQSSGNHIQLVVTGGPVVQYWNPTGAAGIHGGSGVWDSNSPNWSNSAGTTNANWARSIAVFSAGAGSVFVVNDVTASALGFVPGAGAYAITVGARSSLSVNGAGVTNTSGLTQNLVTTADGSGFGTLAFSNSATAGHTTITNQGSDVTGAPGGGMTQFLDKSTAGSAIIINNSGTVHGGGTIFLGTSDGGTAQSMNNGANSFLDISGLTGRGMNIGSLEGGGKFYLGSKTLTVGGNNLSTTVSGIISDGSQAGASGGANGSLVKTGTGTLTLTGANNYTGATIVKGGTLQIGDGVSDKAGLHTSSVAVTAGTTLTLDLANGGQFATKITDGGTVNLTGAGTNSFTAASVIGGAGKLVKTGTGSVTVTGQNSYVGGTTISAGSLVAANPVSSTGSGPVAINSGGTLGGAGKVAAVTLNAGGRIDPGVSSLGVPGTTLTAASLLWNPGGTLHLQLGGTTTDALALGVLTKGTVGAGAGAFTIDLADDGSITPGNFTLATFSRTTFSLSDFTLDLPGTLSGHLVLSSKSLVLDLGSPSSAHAQVAPSEELVPANNPSLSPDASALVAPSDFSPLANVPEPNSAILLAFGAASLLTLRRASRRRGR